MVRFGAHWNGYNKPAAMGFVIGVELIDVIDDATGALKGVCVNAVVWDYDGTIRELRFANASAWEPIA